MRQDLLEKQTNEKWTLFPCSRTVNREKPKHERKWYFFEREKETNFVRTSTRTAISNIQK